MREEPIGSVTRPTDGAEVPALRYVDLNEDPGGSGAALLNDGRYGYDVNDNVVLSALKMETGYNNRNMIVRLYETQGRKTEASIEWPWPVQAVETDLIERPLKRIESEGAILRLTLAPYEIKTVRIIRQPER